MAADSLIVLKLKFWCDLCLFCSHTSSFGADWIASLQAFWTSRITILICVQKFSTNNKVQSFFFFFFFFFFEFDENSLKFFIIFCCLDNIWTSKNSKVKIGWITRPNETKLSLDNSRFFQTLLWWLRIFFTILCWELP